MPADLTQASYAAHEASHRVLLRDVGAKLSDAYCWPLDDSRWVGKARFLDPAAMATVALRLGTLAGAVGEAVLLGLDGDLGRIVGLVSPTDLASLKRLGAIDRADPVHLLASRWLSGDARYIRGRLTSRGGLLGQWGDDRLSLLEHGYTGDVGRLGAPPRGWRPPR